MQDSESKRARAVREMFGAIAGRYDFLNHVLSLNIDRHWRRVCLQAVRERLSHPAPQVLDIGCGTGDLSLAFSRFGPVVGCDFCHPMLQIGFAKVARSGHEHPIRLVEGDALQLPFPDCAFDAVVSAFVLRNLANTRRGLEEMRRVLRPGGVLGILEFGLPRQRVLGGLYLLYFNRVLPCLGRIISGVEGPYRYLPESVRAFPQAEEMNGAVSEAGFTDVQFRPMTGGVAILYLGSARP